MHWDQNTIFAFNTLFWNPRPFISWRCSAFTLSFNWPKWALICFTHSIGPYKWRSLPSNVIMYFLQVSLFTCYASSFTIAISVTVCAKRMLTAARSVQRMRVDYEHKRVRMCANERFVCWTVAGRPTSIFLFSLTLLRLESRSTIIDKPVIYLSIKDNGLGVLSWPLYLPFLRWGGLKFWNLMTVIQILLINCTGLTSLFQVSIRRMHFCGLLIRDGLKTGSYDMFRL